jgi:hypothetical protein
MKKKPSVISKIEVMFKKKELDKHNAEGFNDNELTPLKEIKKLEARGEMHEITQLKNESPAPRFDALQIVRSNTMPLSMAAQEQEDGFSKLMNFLNDKIDVATSTEVTDNELKNIAVLMAAESLKKPKERCDILDIAIDNFLKLRISKDRASRKEHLTLGIAYGLGRNPNKQEGGFDDIKGQIQKMAGKK